MCEDFDDGWNAFQNALGLMRRLFVKVESRSRNHTRLADLAHRLNSRRADRVIGSKGPQFLLDSR